MERNNTKAKYSGQWVFIIIIDRCLHQCLHSIVVSNMALRKVQPVTKDLITILDSDFFKKKKIIIFYTINVLKSEMTASIKLLLLVFGKINKVYMINKILHVRASFGMK